MDFTIIPFIFLYAIGVGVTLALMSGDDNEDDFVLAMAILWPIVVALVAILFLPAVAGYGAWFLVNEWRKPDQMEDDEL